MEDLGKFCIPPSLPHWLLIKCWGHPESHLQDQHLPHPQQCSANFNPFPIKRITKFNFTLFLILLFALLCSNCKDWSWLLQNPRWWGDFRRNQESWEDLQRHGMKATPSSPCTPSSGLGVPMLLRLGFRGEATSPLGGLNPTFLSPKGIMAILGTLVKLSPCWVNWISPRRKCPDSPNSFSNRCSNNAALRNKVSSSR